MFGWFNLPCSCCPLAGLQNKKKMTREDFARINDNTNDGEPMPRELLSHIYQAITREELKISGGRALRVWAALLGCNVFGGHGAGMRT